MEADCVAEPTPVWGDQNHSSPRVGCHYGPIEVHRPVLVGDVQGQKLDLHPFSDKIHESLRLNSSTGDIPDVVAHELKSPLGDSTRGVVVMDDVSQRVCGDNDDLMVGEVVQELPGRHQCGV